jgi:hypothetical protein
MAVIFSGLVGAAITGALMVSLYLVQRSRIELGWQIFSASKMIPRLNNPTPNVHIAVEPKLGWEGEAPVKT